MADDIEIEFLVEPFVEGRPGAHVTAAIEAFGAAGLPVELGPFSSSSRGPADQVADAVAAMIRTAMAAGASAVRIQIGAEPADLDGVRSLQHALDDLVRAAEREIGTPAPQWDRTQKQVAVRMLHERGAFLLRGAVDDIAEVMGVSRITIYNYLNAIE